MSTFSPYICYCSNSKRVTGVCLEWQDGSVIGYDCAYPNCIQDCRLVYERPIGYKENHPSKSVLSE